jgi:hypothetical protein
MQLEQRTHAHSRRHIAGNGQCMGQKERRAMPLAHGIALPNILDSSDQIEPILPSRNDQAQGQDGRRDNSDPQQPPSPASAKTIAPK